jgi:hypothetical protein
MVNLYALEDRMRQHAESLRHEMDQAREAVEKRREPAEPAGAQILRPDSAQYGSRIWRFKSFPAWSRGSSDAKSTERGRL